MTAPVGGEVPAEPKTTEPSPETPLAAEPPICTWPVPAVQVQTPSHPPTTVVPSAEIPSAMPAPSRVMD